MNKDNQKSIVCNKETNYNTKRHIKRKAIVRVHKVVIPVEIDYEKLASTIIKTQLELDKEPESKENIKMGFWKSILLILRGKKDTKDQLTTGVISLPLSMLFQLLSVMGLMLFCVGIYEGYTQAISMSWDGLLFLKNSMFLIFTAAILLIILLYSIILRGAAKELEKTKDKHFVITKAIFAYDFAI